MAAVRFFVLTVRVDDRYETDSLGNENPDPPMATWVVRRHDRLLQKAALVWPPEGSQQPQQLQQQAAGAAKAAAGQGLVHWMSVMGSPHPDPVHYMWNGAAVEVSTVALPVFPVRLRPRSLPEPTLTAGHLHAATTCNWENSYTCTPTDETRPETRPRLSTDVSRTANKSPIRNRAIPCLKSHAPQIRSCGNAPF